jgi:hypothetical protein
MRKIPDLNANYPKVEPIESKYLSRVPAIATFVGHTASGKSYLATGLIKLMKREGSISNLFIISPTASSNTLYRNIYDPAKGDRLYVDIGPQVFESLKEIQMICEAIGDRYELDLKYAIAHQKYISGDVISPPDEFLLESRNFITILPKRPSFALLVDDCQGSALFSRSSKNPFANFVLRSRHIAQGLGISIFMVAQSMKGVPKALRLNSTHWVYFKTMNGKEIEEMYEEVSGFCPKQEFERLFNLYTLPRHGYLFADLPQKKLSNSF